MMGPLARLLFVSKYRGPEPTITGGAFAMGSVMLSHRYLGKIVTAVNMESMAANGSVVTIWTV